jgi:glutamate-1-semialdehyde 2,1-aminomutase
MNAAISDRDLGDRLCFQRVGSMFCLYFTPGPVTSGADAARSDGDRFAIWFHELIERGVAIAPSGFEAGFLSTAHTDEDVDHFVSAAHEALGIAFEGVER